MAKIMSDAAHFRCVVFGAGALGLGFLGPELAPESRVVYVDVPAKADLLSHLRRAGRYVFNETGLSMRPVTVSGVDGLSLAPESDADVLDALEAADLVITAVGAPNLHRLVARLAGAAVRRPAGRPLRILCAENGVEVARNLRRAIEREAGRPLDAPPLVGDTVMGRMCKIVRPARPPVEPPAPGLDWAVVAEPFFGIPVEEHVVAGLEGLPSAIEPQPPARFRASEDVKMLSHNGLHLVLACLGHLRGVRFFDELRRHPDLMALGRRLLVGEAGAALLARHGGALGRSEYLNYCGAILRRVTCPVLHDPIARGVRGIMRKLGPSERLAYSLRTVAEHGARPEVLATGLAAAVVIAQRTGETDMSFDAVLARHCGFDPQADAELIALVESRRALLRGLAGSE